MPKSSRGKSILYVRAASLNDLCRYCSRFDFTSDNLFVTDGSSGARVMAFGESIGKTTIAYYVDMDARSRLIKYTLPTSAQGSERYSFVSNAEEQPGNYLNVIGIDMHRFGKAKSLKSGEISIVMMSDAPSIINAVIKKSMRNEMLLHLYSFKYKDRTVLCGFDLVDELVDDTRIFYYAFSKPIEQPCFARYDYINDKVDFTNTVGEHSYMYTKIINLAEQFPFFRPE
ncbi:MAG: hypothetical protein KGH72_00620 [Candidatus Micrarchaeota archaeon]|nr:hypothetical protein [Candidatus Micrarchaeota archaeon]